MSKSFTSQNITDFLKMLVEIGGVYTVDDMAHVWNAGDESPVVLSTVDGTKKQLSLYYANQTDAATVIVNPFAESTSETKEITWFYHSRSQVMGYMIYKIMKSLLTKALEASKPKTEEAENSEGAESNNDLPANQFKFISPYISKVDDKLLAELNILKNPMLDFFNIYYAARSGVWNVRMGILEKTFRDSYGKRVRQKSWATLESLVTQLLGTKDLNKKFGSKSTQPGYGRLLAYCQTYLNLLKTIEPFKELTNLNWPNLRLLEQHIEMIPQYHVRAKNIVSIGTPKDKASPTTAPFYVSSGNGVAQQPTPQYKAPVASQPSAMPSAQPYTAPPVAPTAHYSAPDATTRPPIYASPGSYSGGYPSAMPSQPGFPQPTYPTVGTTIGAPSNGQSCYRASDTMNQPQQSPPVYNSLGMLVLHD